MDSLYLLGNLVYHGIMLGTGTGKWFITPIPSIGKVYIAYTLIDICRNCSVLLTLAVTTERYVSIIYIGPTVLIS